MQLKLLWLEPNEEQIKEEEENEESNADNILHRMYFAQRGGGWDGEMLEY